MVYMVALIMEIVKMNIIGKDMKSNSLSTFLILVLACFFLSCSNAKKNDSIQELDETFKKDVVGTTRFDGFLVKCSDDDFCYALEKEDYAEEYTVVRLFEEGKQRKTIEENVTFNIKEDCEIYLYKEVEKDGIGKIETEYIIGREFKGDNYPGWSENAKEYYMTGNMLMAIGVVDGELYNAVQVYIP